MTIKNYKRKQNAQKIIKREQYARASILRDAVIDDLLYSKKGDVDLTDEQIAVIKDYWEKYSFALNPSMECYKTYYNRLGVLDPRFIPYAFRKLFKDEFASERYRYSFQDKAYLPKIFSKGRQPRTILRKIDKVILDTEYNHVTMEESALLCYDHIKSGGEIVIKSNASSGGGVSLVFLKDKTLNEIEDVLRNYKSNYTVQESIIQHSVMASLNESTVNTVRLTTFLLGDKVVPLAALIKVGNKDVRVDNYKHGGHMIGINLKTGRTLNWALNIDYDKVGTLPSGVDLTDDGIQVPYFKELVDTAVACHYEAPQIRMIGWDIAIDDQGPLIVEPNFSCDYKMHQVLTGPIFGEYTEQVLDEFLLGKFYISQMNDQWQFEEYSDYVILTNYFGNKKKVIIPESINGKRVKKIGETTFKRNTEICEVYIPDSVTIISPKAFFRCENLRMVRLSKKLRTLQKQTFAYCTNLSKVENLDNVSFIGARCFYHCDQMEESKNNFTKL